MSKGSGSFQGISKSSNTTNQSKLLSNNDKSDILVNDDIEVITPMWKMVCEELLYMIAAGILITILYHYFSHISVTFIIQTFTTVIFFIGGLALLFGSITDLSEHSPMLRVLRKDTSMTISKDKVRKGQSYYISSVILLLLSFIITALEI